MNVHNTKGKFHREINMIHFKESLMSFLETRSKIKWLEGKTDIHFTHSAHGQCVINPMCINYDSKQ